MIIHDDGILLQASLSAHANWLHYWQKEKARTWQNPATSLAKLISEKSPHYTSASATTFNGDPETRRNVRYFGPLYIDSGLKEERGGIAGAIRAVHRFAYKIKNPQSGHAA
jgi:hypothetical protein